MIDRIFKRVKLIWRSTPFGKVSKTSDALKWGIIGTGYMSDTFSQTLNDSHDNILFAIVSRSLDKAKSFAKKHGVPEAFGSIRDMLQCTEIDVVYIATPVECHYDQVKECLMAGKNVLCEKPLTFKSQEAEELFRIANENNCFLMEGMWTMCLPTMLTAKKWIGDGLIGEVRFVRADFNKRQSINHILKHHGVLFDYGIYGVAFINSFMPKDATLTATSSFKSKDNITTDISAIFETEDCQGILNLASNFCSQSKAVVIGTKGSIEWKAPFNRTGSIDLFDVNGHLVDKFYVKYTSEGFEYELNEVYNNIKSERLESELVPGHETITVLRTINKLLNER